MITENLIKAVEKSDLDLVKAIILRQINSDRNEKEFVVLKSCKYAKEELTKNGLLIFEEDNGESHFTEDKNHWNKELWQELRVDFQHNFSEQKINNIVRVMQYLREQGHPDFQVRIASSTSSHGVQATKKFENQGEHRSSRKSDQHGSNSVLIGGAIGSAGGLVVGVLAGKVIGFALGGLVGGLVVGAVISQMKTKERKE